MRTSRYIVVTLKFLKEGRRWTAYCVELGTATFGRSIQEANVRIREAVLLHLNTLEAVGECERFLKEHKVTFYLNKPRNEQVNIYQHDEPGAYFKPFVSPIHSDLRV